jgi:plastocyanin
MAAGEAAARASSTQQQQPNGAAQITIGNFAFNPKMLNVAPGKTVTWVNHDDVPHRIMSANNGFPPSSVLDTKATYGATFAKPGEYPYFCSIHPTMTGKIVVG